MPGPDPMDAARAVDAQHDEVQQQGEAAVGAAIAPPPEPERRNSLPAGPHSQGVAGMLMAKEEEFKRVDMELQDRHEKAAGDYDLAMAKANADFHRAQEIALSVLDAERIGISREQDDVERARAGIKAAIDALT